MTTDNITIISLDGIEFDLSKDLAKRSVLIKNMIEDLDVDDEEFRVPTPNVTGAVMKTVIQWLEHHKDTEFPDDDDNDTRKSAPIDDWDTGYFTKMGLEMVYQVILAANYLNIRPLLDAGCKHIASLIRGKSPEEIRKTFSVKEDSIKGASA